LLIKDLKELIEGMEDDDIVSFQMLDGCCGDFIEMDLNYTDQVDIGNNSKFARIQFEQLPGYKTCRQSADTLRRDSEYCKPKTLDLDFKRFTIEVKKDQSVYELPDGEFLMASMAMTRLVSYQDSSVYYDYNVVDNKIEFSDTFMKSVFFKDDEPATVNIYYRNKV
jgi:hypothetical protein